MLYQLQVLLPCGELRDTTWPPRSFRSASAVARYCKRNWPENSYWLRPIYPSDL